jgi:hypothetical protein
MMSVLMQLSVQRVSSVSNMSLCNSDLLMKGEIFSYAYASCVYNARTDVSKSDM